MEFPSSFIMLLFLFHVTIQVCQAQHERDVIGVDDIETAYYEPNVIAVIENRDADKDIYRNSGLTRELVLDKVSESDISRADVAGVERVLRATNTGNDRIQSQTLGKNRRGRVRKRKSENRRKLKKNKLHNKNSVAMQERDKLISLEDKASEFDDSGDDQVSAYYMSKQKISNVSGFLGPGPIPIPMNESSIVKKHSSSRANSTVSLNDARNLSLIVDDSDFLSSYRGDNRRGRRRKLKHGHKKVVENVDNMADLIPHPKKRKKENKMIHKHGRYSKGYHNYEKRKHKKIHSDGINTKKDIDKYILKDSAVYTNLSAINKSFMNKAGKLFYDDLKNGFQNARPVDFRSQVSELRSSDNSKDGGMVVIDRMNSEDARKMGIINELHKREEGNVPKDVNKIQPQRKNNGENHRHKSQGSQSKIAYGNWLSQVTIWPPIDTLANKTQYKKKISLSEPIHSESEKNKQQSQNFSQKMRTLLENKQYLRKENSNKNVNNPHKTVDKGKNENREFSAALFKTYEDAINKRNQRDTFRGLNKRRLSDRMGSRRVSQESQESEREREGKGYDSSEERYIFRGGGRAKNKQASYNKEEPYNEYGEKCDGNYLPNTRNFYPNRSDNTNKDTTGLLTTECIYGTTTPPKQGKSKNTSKINTKTPPTSNTLLGNEKGRGSDDSYALFLSGQLADDFVEAVLGKVRRSKKIQRELGFSNDTEETCDRCVELKPPKIPDLSVMKSSMGQCLRDNKIMGNSSMMCCSVPKPMVRFLNVLVYHEIENEINFYNKISDDSSFVFTGDYTDTLKGEKKMKTHDEGYFDRGTFDKQHLREESSEEKYDEKNPSQNILEGKKGISSLRKEAQKKEDKVVPLKRTEDIDNADESKRNIVRLGKNKSGLKEDKKLQGPEKDILEFGCEPRDMFSSDKKYPTAKDKEIHFGELLMSERTKSERDDSDSRIREPDRFMNSERSWSSDFDNNKNSYYRENNYEHDTNILSKSPSASNSDYKSSHSNPRSEQNFMPGDRSRNNDKRLPSYNMPKSDDEFSRKNDYFGYRQILEGHKTRRKENGDPFAPKYGSLSYREWDDGEYELYPNWDSQNCEGDYNLNKNNRHDRDNSLRMVKRDTDSGYDDDFVFVEIPDAEYDLYEEAFAV